jgi:MerR family transcriptional regulator, heat shock protein HspR
VVDVKAPWPEPDRALFSISVAAELSGLHPQTLRSYEREGLLEPTRTPGGTRRYSGAEVDRLRQISALADAGVNIAGMRRVLDLEQIVRRLQARLSKLEAMEAEMRKLRTEGASLEGADGRNGANGVPAGPPG